MDANRRIIPIVEGDQGEGIMDPLDIDDLKEYTEECMKALHKVDQNFQNAMIKNIKQFQRQRR